MGPATAQYYGLLGVSMRDALHQLHTTDEAAIATMFQPIWDGDATHPSCVGSRSVAGRSSDSAKYRMAINAVAGAVLDTHETVYPDK